MTDTISGNINFAGLGSGTDFTTLIEGLMKVERRRIDSLQAQKDDYQKQLEGTQDLNSKLLALKTSMEGMDHLGEFLTRSVSSSDESVVTATATGEALEGTHTLWVNQLAKNQVLVSNRSFANATTDLTGGAAKTFVYTYAGTQHTLNVSAGTTLESLASSINTDPNNPGVKASVLKVSDTDYRLQFWGLDMGAANTLTVDAATTLDDFNGGTPGTDDFTVSQAAQNAQVRVDGYPAATWIERSTNTIDDLVAGVTLNLKSVGPAQDIVLNITTDTAEVKDKVTAFVKAVNEVRAKITELTKVDTSTNTASLLTGSFGISSISQTLKSITSSSGLGFDSNNDAFSVLSQLGITTDATEGSTTYGQLLIDETKLDDALEQDSKAVADLFAAYYDGSSDSPAFSYASSIVGTTKAGKYAVSYTMAGGTATGTIDGHAATWDAVSKQLTGASGTPVAGLAILVNNLTDGAYSGNVRIKLGKSGELAESLKGLTSTTSGPLSLAEDGYNDLMESIDDRIEYEEERIARLERQYKDRFSRLDATLSYYNNVMTGIQSQLGSLATSSNN